MYTTASRNGKYYNNNKEHSKRYEKPVVFIIKSGSDSLTCCCYVICFFFFAVCSLFTFTMNVYPFLTIIFNPNAMCMPIYVRVQNKLFFLSQLMQFHLNIGPFP